MLGVCLKVKVRILLFLKLYVAVNRNQRGIPTVLTVNGKPYLEYPIVISNLTLPLRSNKPLLLSIQAHGPLVFLSEGLNAELSLEDDNYMQCTHTHNAAIPHVSCP